MAGRGKGNNQPKISTVIEPPDVDKFLSERLPKGTPDTVIERMKKLDPKFAKKLEDIEVHWLNDANEILKELMVQIRILAQNPMAELKDVIKALDVISNKYNLHQGLPTSIEEQRKKITNLTDEDLDDRINQLQRMIHSELTMKNVKKLPS
jgi:hypothetical protein